MTSTCYIIKLWLMWYTSNWLQHPKRVFKKHINDMLSWKILIIVDNVYKGFSFSAFTLSLWYWSWHFDCTLQVFIIVLGWSTIGIYGFHELKLEQHQQGQWNWDSWSLNVYNQTTWQPISTTTYHRGISFILSQGQ